MTSQSHIHESDHSINAWICKDRVIIESSQYRGNRIHLLTQATQTNSQVKLFFGRNWKFKLQLILLLNLQLERLEQFSLLAL